MKKKFLILTLVILILSLPGCSLLDGLDSPIILDGEPIETQEKKTNSGKKKTEESTESSETEEETTEEEETKPEEEKEEEKKKDKKKRKTASEDRKKDLPEGGEDDPITERRVSDGKMQSYLTGEWMDEKIVQRRNIAVMIPNSQLAGSKSTSPLYYPYGITSASVIYEAPVEGRDTCLMGLFEDYDYLDKIGPVAISRDYFIYQAMSFDSVYVNWGMTRICVEELINTERIDNISAPTKGIYNPVEAAFETDKSEIPGAATDYNGYLLVDELPAAMEANGYQSEYRDSFEQAFLFANDKLATYKDYPEATLIYPGGTEINAGGYGNYGEENPYFEYDAGTHLYYRYQYGRPMYDQMTRRAVGVTNVIFKICHGEERTPNDRRLDYLAFGIHGSGECYVFTNGRVIHGTWQKNSDTGADRFYDENGKEIVLNQGKTWLCNIWLEYSQFMTYEAPEEEE